MPDQFAEKVKELTYELWDAQTNEIKALDLAIKSLEKGHKILGEMLELLNDKNKPN